jgi:hypothetical protein
MLMDGLKTTELLFSETALINPQINSSPAQYKSTGQQT